MYTLMPYRSNKEMSHKNTGWFADPLFDRFFDMGDWFGSSAFRVDVKDLGDKYELHEGRREAQLRVLRAPQRQVHAFVRRKRHRPVGHHRGLHRRRAERGSA